MSGGRQWACEQDEEAIYERRKRHLCNMPIDTLLQIAEEINAQLSQLHDNDIPMTRGNANRLSHAVTLARKLLP